MTTVMVAVIALLLTDARWLLVASAVILAFLLTAAPLPGIGLLLIAGLVMALRRLAIRRQAPMADSADLARLCDLMALSLTGGLGMQAALELAATETGGRIGAEVAGAIRSVRVGGMAVVMSTAEGIGRPLYRTLGRAAATGAGILQPVTELADRLNADLAARQLEAVRRKPIAMLFPLTLLILPGFLLLVVAPAILEALGRLDV